MADFRTDCVRLRKWLDARRRVLEQRRLPYERTWRDIRENFCPELGHSLKGDVDANEASASRDDDKIFNSTPRILHQKLAAGLQSGITNQARQWFVFRAKDEGASKSAGVRQYLGAITKHLHDRMAASNVYAALDQMYLRLSAFGQSAALLLPDEEAVMRLSVCDEGAYWIAEDRRGRVRTLMRRLRYTLSQLQDDFGRASLPQGIADRIDRGEHETEQTVWHLVFPVAALPHDLAIPDIPADREAASVYWIDGGTDENGGILAIRSFDYNPVIAPRWLVNGLSVYGHGPGEFGLGDAKALQEIELASLRLTELESNPPMAAPSGMKGVPLDTGPGGLNYYDPIADGGKGIPIGRLFETRQSIEAVEVKIQAITDRLNRIFYVDLFAMLLNLEMRQQPRTATEVNELSQEKVSLLGPVLTRLNQDLLKPLVESAWHLAYRRAQEDASAAGYDATGILAAPEALTAEVEPDENGEVDALAIEYTSTLHAEQQFASRLAGPFRFVEFYGGVQNILQKPDLADNIDGDKMIRDSAPILDSSGYIIDEDKVREVRQARAAEQQRQVAAEQEALAAQAQQQRAQSVHDLAEAQLTDGGTALDMVAEAQGVGL